MITRGMPVVRPSVTRVSSGLDTPSSFDSLPPPAPPRWIADEMPHPRELDLGSAVHAVASGELVLLSTTIPDARRLDADGLREEVARSYAAVGAALQSGRRHAIRWWNYLPDPGQMMGPGLDRYMVFNAGRSEGYPRTPGDEAGGRSLATASAVGLAGDDLVIHCLAARRPGRPVENPRQKPAWRYSSRYGPVPPSFSRATIADLGGRSRLLIGGTASVVGEDSMHVGNVQAQMDETFCNLATLVSAACDRVEPPSGALARLQDVRVYLPRAQHGAVVQAAVQSRCPHARVELLSASLCRPELLIEIEGVAEI
jgi:chorismate lyase/3-hydroxybenzoate synthase